MKGPVYLLEMISSDGKKATFQDYGYEFHFSFCGKKFWRCLSHWDGCTAQIMSKGSLMYIIESKHRNHLPA